MTIILWGLVAVAVLPQLYLLLIAAFSSMIGGGGPTVETARPAYTSIKEAVTGTGTLTATHQVALTPDVSGEVVELYVKESDPVTQGMLLLKIKPDRYLSALDRQRAHYSKTKVTTERTQLELARAEARYKRERNLFARQKALYENDMLAAADFEEATSRHEEEKSNWEIAKKNIVFSQYDLEGAHASVEEAEENLSLTNVHAPMAGVVTRLTVEVGERVVGTRENSGTDMLTISRLDEISVHIDVNENDINRIQLGAPAFTRVESLLPYVPYVTGQVGKISYLAKKKSSNEELTEFSVRIDIPQSTYKALMEEVPTRHPLRPGLSAAVKIIVEERENVLSVPLSAVVTRPKEKKEREREENPFSSFEEDVMEVIFVHQKGHALQRRVKTGISDFENIEILTGLEADEEVITGPYRLLSRGLTHEQPVSAVPAPPKGAWSRRGD